jgi:sugar porter (SP) family MFS transporter
VVLRAAVVAARGGRLFGFDRAVISGTTNALERVFHLDDFWLGFTVAIALIGTVVGSFAAGKPADVFGRKNVLFVLASFYFVSAIGCGLAQDWGTFLAARFLGGLAIGGASVVAPMYIAEIAPGPWRGRLVALSQLNVVIGIVLSYLSNYLLAEFLDEGVAWRWMLGVVAFPSAAFFLLLFTIPESPRWLVKEGRADEAGRVLTRLGEPDVPAELAAIRASLADQPGHAQERLFQRRYARAVFLAWAVAMFNQLSGINALIYYAPRIFALAGAAQDEALLQSVAVGGTNLAFTIAAMFLIDRVGRRPLLLVGSVGTAACMAAAAAALASAGGWRGPVLLAAMLGYIAFFAFSQGAVIWVFIAEVFPNPVRAKGQALGSFTHWFMNALVSLVFPLIARVAAPAAFAFFAAMMVLQFFFAWKVMPETRGGTLEDIEQRLLAPERGGVSP